MKHMARRYSAALAACAASLLVPTAAERASAADCTLEQQGEGRVAAIVDTRSLRLDDGREIRLAGIERGRADRRQRQGSPCRHRRRPRGDAAWR